MKMSLKLFSLAIVFAVGMSVPMSAHHSHGQYDLRSWHTMEGVVKAVQWINPHSVVYVDIKDAQTGQVRTWALEATSPNGIINNGVKREDVKAGDPVTVRFHLLRDGAAGGGLLGYITPKHGDPARGHGVEKDWD
jgi:hypothetical protein